jgi:hypothetical protein
MVLAAMRDVMAHGYALHVRWGDKEVSLAPASAVRP